MDPRQSELTSPGPPEGPRTIYTAPDAARSRHPIISGTTVKLLLDSTAPLADLYAGVISFDPGAAGPLHWHEIGELAYVLRGTGLLIDVDAVETRVKEGGSIWHPCGESGAHAIRNDGPSPLEILFVYASPHGEQPRFLTRDQPAREPSRGD